MSSGLMSRCGGLRVLLLPRSSLLSRSSLFNTCTRVSSEAKTPIQKWGWDYLLKQEGLKRPLSPHLTVYKPMLTWMMSGGTRISGVVMAGALFVGGVGMMVVPFDFTTAIETVRGWGLPAPVTALLRFIIALPICFHATNAMRHIGFNFGYGLGSMGVIYQTGWTALAFSIALALVVTFWRSDPALSQKQVTGGRV